MVWIAWERQRRNRELSDAFGIQLVEWPDLDSLGHSWKKYWIGVRRTTELIWHTRPKVVFCMNPSLFLALWLLFLRPLFSYFLVVDSHNAGLFPVEGRSRFLGTLARIVGRFADLTLVSNECLSVVVAGWGGSAAVLPDRTPEFSRASASRPFDLNRVRIVFICTWSADEPYLEFLDAVADLPADNYEILISGNYLRAGIRPEMVAECVRLTGFVSEDEYEKLLSFADVVVVLTNRDDCLLCGAYEAVGAEKPMVLSDTAALRRYFSGGAEYCRNDPVSIRDAIMRAVSDHDSLSQAVTQLKQKRTKEWNEQFGYVRARILEDFGV